MRYLKPGITPNFMFHCPGLNLALSRLNEFLYCSFIKKVSHHGGFCHGVYFTAAQTRYTSSFSSRACRNSPTSWRWASVSSGHILGMKPISLVMTVQPLAESHLVT